ncbi:MAG: replication-associated recombination protein A [Gammaproteobacteria bacterium]|nr:replication-associated recombination protein A [Gammaproteobacteria bacterium]
MRPQQLDDVVGQEHLLGSDKPLRLALSCGQMHSMIFWGPPGTGKTTLARLLARRLDAEFISLSAVLSGVKEIRVAIERAEVLKQQARRTLLFIDEVHRFNKSQQDAFLPHVENGTIVFIGATTENPSFALNNALLSRARVYKLQPLHQEALEAVIQRALSEDPLLAPRHLQLAPLLRQRLASVADGDARRALNLLEIAADLATGNADDDDVNAIDGEILQEIIAGSGRRFDRNGDDFYDQISALHKSVRGSDPDASLYWLARMLDGGCDPLYIARRVVRMASEDIGNADPRGLAIALDAWQVQERLGSPEGELAIAQAVTYLACAAKSNAIYTAFKAARADVAAHGSLEVPLHLRNAPTRLMKEMGYGKSYRYAHDEPEAFAAGECYLPDSIAQQRYYYPVDRGLEQKIGEKLNYLRKLNQDWEKQHLGKSP